MQSINFPQVKSLIRFIAEQVVVHFFQTLKCIIQQEDWYYHDAVDYLVDRIVDEIAGTWNDVTTVEQADAKVEAMYNAARTALLKQLELDGGTVEFGPGDVQPLTDQRLGQSEAWELWIERMAENGYGED